tara:strand:+ start:597 stop:1565 length:969 start_codon:yes stop_codon:yes gene_type:complete
LSNYKPILIVPGEPNSIFFEIFFKNLKYKKFKSPIILIGSIRLLKLQMKKLNFNKKIIEVNLNTINKKKLNNHFINIINVNFKQKAAFEKISSKSKKYIEECFKIAKYLIKKKITNKLITGPISKEKFLNKRFLGITEYLGNLFKVKKIAMLIYNKKLSVCPITTHLPLKSVNKKIKKKNIVEKVELIKEFYIKNFKINPRIGILSLNPHSESIDKFNEDKRIIAPAIKYLKNSNYNISGPIPADTAFMKKNRENFDVIVGMYHDQVLTPLKTLFEYNAINITLGLPFIRISPDHGPNEKMLGKNISNPLSLIQAISFLDKN